jgi:beta-ketodecanoyl-[acyl-carrier-protein] synthase
MTTRAASSHTAAHPHLTPAILESGVFIPSDTISNEELSTSFNQYIAAENILRIPNGEAELERSSADFIFEASGIQNRQVIPPQDNGLHK